MPERPGMTLEELVRTSAVQAPPAVKAMLGDGQELALLDVREELIYSQSHLLWARSLPLSRLELRFARLCRARHAHRAVDDIDGLAERAAAVLSRDGYSESDVLDGGSRGLGGGRLRAVLRRQRAEQGVRRVRRARQRHAEHLGRRARDADPRARRHRGARQPPVRRIFARVDPDRHQRAGRRAGAARARPRALARHDGGGQLRRPHAQHHRRAVADQRRRAQQGGRAAQRHHGLDARRPHLRPRQGPSARRSRHAKRRAWAQSAAGEVGAPQRRRAHRSRTR